MCLVVLAGCEPAERGCTADSQCGGGVCVNGACKPLAGNSDLSADDGGLPPPDFSQTIPDGWSPDALAGTCTLNNNGILERSEAPFLPGLGGLFAIPPAGQTTTVAAQPQSGTFDFSAGVNGERKVFDQLVAPGSYWWASEFPSATHAQRLSDEKPLWGVYKATNGALELLGVASEQDGAQRTLLKYTTPIEVLKFPLQVGTMWQSESDFSGYADGIFVAGHETYSFNTDVRATTKVPAGNFDTLRLRINYRQQVGFLVTTRYQHLHLAECYGAVARLRSRDGESNADFTIAAEYRRLSAP